MIIKQDYAIAALIGFFIGIFALPTLINLGIKGRVFLIILPMVTAILFACGVWAGGMLARRFSFFAQFSKFVAVGFLNTAIDFGILNLLSLATGITGGLQVGGVNIPGFSVAVVNGYLWNQLWVFRARSEGEGLFHDFPKFLAVTIVGLAINSGIIVMATTYIHPFSGVGKETWLNLAKVAATAISLFWNFTGYKFLVFRKRVNVSPQTSQ